MRWVSFATVLSGVLGYVVVLCAAVVLGADQFAIFNVVWALFFTLTAVLQGLLLTTAHAVRTANRTSIPIIDENANGIDDADELVVSGSPLGLAVVEDRTAAEIAANDRYLAPHGSHRASLPSARPGVRPLEVGAWLGGILAGIVAAFSPAWAPYLLAPAEQPVGVLLFSLAAGMLTLQSTYAGMLIGTGRWRSFSVLLILEAVTRIAVAAVLLLLDLPMQAFVYAAIGAALVGPVLLVFDSAGRQVRGLRTDLSMADFVIRATMAVLGAAMTGLFVVGAPVLIWLVRSDIDPLVLGNLLLAIVLTRALTLTPITSFQTALAAHFVARRRDGVLALLLPVTIVLVVGAGMSAVLWFLAPGIFPLFGQTYGLGGDVIVELAFGGVLTAVLYLTAAAVRAHGRRRAEIAGWATALSVAILILALLPDPLEAVPAAFIIGAAAGALIHVMFGIPRRVRRAAPKPVSERFPAVEEMSH